MILFLNTIIPDAENGEVICLPEWILLLKPDKVKQKNAILSSIVPGYLLVICYDDKLDRLLVTEWNSSNAAVTFDSQFLGGFYYKGFHWGRNLQKPLSTWSSDRLLYNSKLTDDYVSINLDDQILRKVPGYKGQNTAAVFLACHGMLCTGTHLFLWVESYQNSRRQCVSDGNKKQTSHGRDEFPEKWPHPERRKFLDGLTCISSLNYIQVGLPLI